MKIHSVLITVLLLLTNSCSKSTPETIQQKDWGISIDVLPYWVYEIKDTLISISTSKENFVKGVMHVDYIVDSDLEDIEDYLNAVTTGIGGFFEGYQMVSDGRTEVNGHKTIWYRMKSTLNGSLTEVMVYTIELERNHFINITCAARADTFPAYEPEFTEMVYSLKRIR